MANSKRSGAAALLVLMLFFAAILTGCPGSSSEFHVNDDDAGIDEDAQVDPQDADGPTEDAGPTNIGQPDADLDADIEPDAQTDTDVPTNGCDGDEVYCDEAGGCVDLQSDPMHCGQCGEVCTAPDQGIAQCIDGSCQTSCSGSAEVCGDACVNLQTDPDHCGDCDSDCSDEMVCSQGTCQEGCGTGETDCTGACVDTDSDVFHCGGCNSPCTHPPDGQALCVDGQCGFDCDADFMVCGDGCVPDDGSFDICGGQCTELDVSTDHCGSCGNSCDTAPANGSPSCFDGQCSFECDSGFQRCGDECIADTEACDFCDPDSPAEFGGGSGTEDQPYLICAASHLAAIGEGDHSDAHFRLMADIDMADLPAGEELEPIGPPASPFSGSFDGNNHGIENLSIQRSEPELGLFRRVETEGEIFDLQLVNVDLWSDEITLGGLAGLNRGTISNILITGEVRSASQQVGGLVGRNEGHIEGVEAEVEVWADEEDGAQAGGLAGENRGTITDSTALGDVVTDGDDGAQTGGFVGLNAASGEISEAQAHGAVIAGAISDDQDRVGGFAGENRGTLTDVVAHGDVLGSVDVGGLVGINTPDGEISEAQAHGAVDGRQSVGGLVGNHRGTLSNCEADGNVSMTHGFGGGLIGVVAEGATVDQCQVHGDVDGGDQVTGGLAGLNQGTISNSGAHGAVSGADSFVGGLAGVNEDTGTISQCVATGTVDADSSSVGGLAGLNDGLVEDSAAQGAVDAAGPNTGGLVGSNSGSIANSSADGNVDGGDHTVGGLVGANTGTITDSEASGDVTGDENVVGGLVGSNTSSGTVTDSEAHGDVLSTTDFAGGFAGANQGEITGALATGLVLAGGGSAGGLVGTNQGDLQDCFTTGSVEATDNSVGGLVGANFSSINRCRAEAQVTGGAGNLGGLVGYNAPNGTIAQSAAHGAVSDGQANFVGGLVGANNGAISNSYAAGAVHGNLAVGGLTGNHADNEAITNSHAIGAVTGDGTGGLVGPTGSEPGDVVSSYWDPDTTGQTDSAAGTSRSTAEFGQTSSFPGWDFSTGGVWEMSTILDGELRPILQWE